MCYGNIFDVQRCSFTDGPGIRTTVFFKGCNLRCKWCHNPESWEDKPQILIYQEKCTHCGKCIKICPKQAISEQMETDRRKCISCGECEVACPHDARKVCGKKVSVQDVFEQIAKDIPFFATSDGGVTFSGGECMLQIAFLGEILKMCKEHGIHTAVDTAGNVNFSDFKVILPYVDLFRYDIKCMTNELHLKGTGFGNQLILENLKKLLSIQPQKIDICIPIIPDFNATKAEIQKMRDYFVSYGKPHSVTLLPYHKLGENKYAAIDRDVPAFHPPSADQMREFNQTIGL